MSEESAPDARVAQVAARQYGVVSVSQLRDAGIGKDRIHSRTRTGRLYRVHRGVYAVGHPALAAEGRWMAAVLAIGHGAALSHVSAAALWRLLEASSTTIDVSLSSRGGRRRRTGIRVHRCGSLAPTDVTRKVGIPVTTPSRTVRDLRRVLPGEKVRAAMRQAAVLGLPLEIHPEPELGRSELERHFLLLCRRHRLPVPEVNVRVGRFIVDFLWVDASLIAEVDGFRYHRGREAFEADRSRDVELRLLGFDVIRLTYRQVVEEPADVARAVRALLGGRVPRNMSEERAPPPSWEGPMPGSDTP